MPKEYKPLKYVYIPSKNKAAYTLVMLHGTGADENDLLPLAFKFGTELNILSLRGNVLENGMPRFFKRLEMGVFDEEDLNFRTHEMIHFIKWISVQEDFDFNRLIAIGYSNGANIAGSTLLLYPNLLAGAILYRPMQPFTSIDFTLTSSRHTPVFMSNGSFDPTISKEDTAKYETVLKQMGFRVTAHLLPLGHQLSQNDIQLSLDWFEKISKDVL